MNGTHPIRIDFVCVENAGRSQMAAAFAERESEERGLTDVVEIHSAGTDPADGVHPPVVEAMAEVDVDVADRSPSYVVLEDLRDSHYLVTMGCTIDEFSPSSFGVEARAWDLQNPADRDLETVRRVRDEVETKVRALFDEIERTAADRGDEAGRTGRVTDAIKRALSF